MSERIYAPFSENLQLTKVFQKIVKYIEYEIKKSEIKIINQNIKIVQKFTQMLGRKIRKF